MGGIQTLTESLQAFYAVKLHHQPVTEIGVEGGISTRTSLVLTKFCSRLNFVRLATVPPLRHRKIGTDGEIRTRNNSFLRRVPLPFGYVGGKIEICNQAVKAPDKNPTFVLFVTTRASTKNSAKAKFKKKYFVSGIKPLKLASSNKTSEYWNVKVLSLNLTITKEEDGQLKGFNSLIH